MANNYKQEIAAINPVLWATMDETSGNVNNTGTLGGTFTKGSGAGYWDGDTSKVAPIGISGNGSFNFDGSNTSFISLNNASFRNSIVEDWTYEAWVYPTDIASGKGILLRNAGSFTFEIGINTSGFLYVKGGSGSGTALCTAAMQNNTWYHICIQKYLGNRFAFCFNGAFKNESIAQTAFGGSSGYSNITHIGSSSTAAFKGYYDEVSFAPVSISIADMQRHYASRNWAQVPVKYLADPMNVSVDIPMPAVRVGTRIRVDEAMQVSTEMPEPTVKVGVSVKADPMNVSVSLAEPTVFSKYPVVVQADPMLVSVELGDAKGPAGLPVKIEAEPMAVSVEMPEPRAIVPTVVHAEPMNVSVELGQARYVDRVVVQPEPMRVSVQMPAPADSAELGDSYFDVTSTTVDGDDVWLRLREAEGTVAKNEVSATRAGTYTNAQFGSFGPGGRPAVKFGIGSSLSFAIVEPGTIEFTMRTTQANGRLAYGNSFASTIGNAVRHYEVNLVSGRIQVRWRGYNNGQFGEWNVTLVGNKRIDDGEWHHVVLTQGWDPAKADYLLNLDSGYSVFIDGKLDKRVRFDSRAPGGGLIAVRAVSQMFDGIDAEVLEVVIRNAGNINKYQIEQGYYALFGLNVFSVDGLAEVSVTMPDAKAKVEGTSILCLYTSITNAPVQTNPEEHLAMGGQAGTTYSGQIGQPTFYNKSYAKNGTVTHYYSTFNDWRTGEYEGWTDPVTDEPRFIDLRTDVDSDEYDVIWFMDLPPVNPGSDGGVLGNDVSRSNYSARYKQMLDGIRWAVTVKGKSLLVTQPQLARDLGIISGFEVHDIWTNEPRYTGTIRDSHLRGRWDYPASRVDPWDVSYDGIEPAHLYADTHKPDKARMVKLLEGFSSIPGYVLLESIDFYNYLRKLNYVSWRYEDRAGGYKVGDEVEDGARLKMTSVKPDQIRAGQVIAKESQYRWNLRTRELNPWRENATIIALEPGDELQGEAIEGRVFVAFNHGAGQAGNSGNISIDLRSAIDQTKPTAKWQRSMMRMGYASTNFEGGLQGAQLVYNPASGRYELVERGLSGSVVGVIETDFPHEFVYGPTIMERAWLWLLDKKPAERVIIEADPMNVGVEMPDPTVTAKTETRVLADPMFVGVEFVAPAGVAVDEVRIRPFPMEVSVEMPNLPTVVRADPMLVSVQMPDPLAVFDYDDFIEVIWQSKAQITLYVQEER